MSLLQTTPSKHRNVSAIDSTPPQDGGGIPTDGKEKGSTEAPMQFDVVQFLIKCAPTLTGITVRPHWWNKERGAWYSNPADERVFTEGGNLIYEVPRRGPRCILLVKALPGGGTAEIDVVFRSTRII